VDSFNTVLHVVSHASFRLAKSGLVKFLVYVRQISNEQDKNKQNNSSDRVALASALDKTLGLSLFFRHHGRIRWGREGDIVIIEG